MHKMNVEEHICTILIMCAMMNCQLISSDSSALRLTAQLLLVTIVTMLLHADILGTSLLDALMSCYDSTTDEPCVDDCRAAQLKYMPFAAKGLIRWVVAISEHLP